MKKIVVITLALCLVAGFAYGQEYRSFDKALLFGIPNLGTKNFPLFGLGDNFGGIGFKIAYNKYFIRPILLFTLSNEKGDDDEGWVGQRKSGTDWGFVVDILKHIHGDKVTPYIGAGLGFIQEGETVKAAHAEGQDAAEVKTSTTNYFVRALLGVEYFMRKNVSLSGEYQFAYTHFGTTMENGFEDKTSGSQFGVNVVARILLAIYIY